jgi:hypothetical protein
MTTSTTDEQVRSGTGPVDPAVSTGGGWVRAAVWLPGLAVAIGAAIATAHGLYEVAAAATVPTVIAWLYPLITDGLALVAYTATARLAGSARRYAWGVVVLAAGLSGLAQASYLASAGTGPGLPGEPPPVFEVSAALRFGIGAWPAVAAAVVAHLLYLLAESTRPTEPAPTARSGQSVAEQEPPGAVSEPVAPVTEPLQLYTLDRSTVGVHSALFNPPVVRAAALNAAGIETAAEPLSGVQPAPGPGWSPELFSGAAEPGRPRGLESPVRDRAHSVATAHLARRGALPTVSELEAAAQVSRGTAAAVLKALREHPDTTQSPRTTGSTTETENQNS